MDSRLVIAAILLLFPKFSISISVESFNCTQLSDTEPHPSYCCDFPILTLNDSTLTECFRECPIMKGKKHYKNSGEHENARCCLMRCNYRKPGILIDSKKVSKEVLKENFAMSRMKKLTSEWEKIISDVVDECVPLYKPGSRYLKGECLPEFFGNILICLYNQIFLKCAGFKEKQQKCKNLREIVKKCNGDGEVTIKEWDEFYF